MKRFDVSFVGADTPRNKIVQEQICKMIRAVISGRTGWLNLVKPDETAHVKFVLDATPIDDEHALIIDLSGRQMNKEMVAVSILGKETDTSNNYAASDQNLIYQPALLNMVIAGKSPPADPWAKINNMDSDQYPNMAVIIPDGYNDDLESLQRDFPDSVFTESQVFENPDLFVEKYSHAILVSQYGGPLLCERLLAYSIVQLFYVGATPGNVDLRVAIPCGSIDDALVKANALVEASGGTASFYKTNVVERVFAQDAVTARDARTIIGSALNRKFGDAFGFMEMNTADQRLLEMVKGGPQE